MVKNCFYCAGSTPALKYASSHLEKNGVVFSESLGWDTKHLLLDVPSFRPGLWSEEALDTLLSSLPKDVTVWGGNLNHPALDGFRCMDLLTDETYLQENALITAHCTLPIAAEYLTGSWKDTPTLIIGWGRIGKALTALLREIGCPVTVASRNPRSPGLSEASEISIINSDQLHDVSFPFHLIVNTAPAQILTQEDIIRCRDCIKIDLASVRGIPGDDVIWARALPGRCAPEQSGRLIADTVLRLWKEETP